MKKTILQQQGFKFYPSRSDRSRWGGGHRANKSGQIEKNEEPRTEEKQVGLIGVWFHVILL